MNLDALDRVFGLTQPAPAGLPSTAAERPQEAPAHLDIEHAAAAPVGWTGAAVGSLDGLTLADLQAAAGTDWPEIEHRPESVDALARLLRTHEQRRRGLRPDGYTRPALCATCGPVWLWPGCPARVLACPWCLTLPDGAAIPRPPVRCRTCNHFTPSTSEPAAALGSCKVNARASRIPPALFPNAAHPCGDWRELGTTATAPGSPPGMEMENV